MRPPATALMTLELLLLLLCAASLSLAAAQSQTKALLEFKKGIKRDPLGKVLDSWVLDSSADPNACPATWYGVSCEGVNVVALMLEQLDLAGELKLNTLTGLGSLKNLSLAGNSFTGRLAPVLFTMVSLQHFDLSNNQFYGPIPGKFTGMWALNYVNLSSNSFDGEFPSGIENLQLLRVLDLHSNRLTGDVGDILRRLVHAEVLDLSSNMLYGEISGDMSSFVYTVRHMNLSRNGLVGGFFREDAFSTLQNLAILDLSYNQLTGNLPPFSSLRYLQVLRLGNNQFTGDIPEELLESSMPIVELDLSVNGFTGSIHEISSTSLNILNLSSNGLSGPMPLSFRKCSVVDLSRNMLSGPLPDMRNWEPALEVIDLSSNNLSGTLPNASAQFENLTSFVIRNNSISGGLPSTLGSLAKLFSVDVSLNRMTGDIPASLFTSRTLIYLNLSGNGFTGKIPFQGPHAVSELNQAFYPLMETLDLSSNALSGVLSPDVGSLERLQCLNLSKNRLSGKLPDELSKLTELEYLDLSSNYFNGEIPQNLSSKLLSLNLSRNDFSGVLPENLRHFPVTSFQPGNNLLILNLTPPPSWRPFTPSRSHLTAGITAVIVLVSIFVVAMIVILLGLYYRRKFQEFHKGSAFGGQSDTRDAKPGRSAGSHIFKSGVEPPVASLSFSQDHLLSSHSRSISSPKDDVTTEIVEQALPDPVSTSAVIKKNLSGRKSSSGSPSSSPRFIENQQPAMLDVSSPDRLAGQLLFLDSSISFTGEELSRAPAEILGRSSHGTLYKATLPNGHMLTVKWLRVGLVKNKKDFAKEIKRIGSIRHANIVSPRAYYWGPREQERLLLADYIEGDSVALHLYETTPRRYPPLSFNQRLKVAVEMAGGLLHLHERNLSHGNLKPTNILLSGPNCDARLVDGGLHRLMTSAGISEQILNLTALGYGAPELANNKPAPTLKADVYSLGVVFLELLTRRSAGDIISGQSGAVDLTDWVRLCNQAGRGIDCIDRDMAGGEEPSRAMDEFLAVAVSCILPDHERPNIRQVYDALRVITPP
uniref:Protein kinase domain-containing protein n=2 Tax=Kalanchoe fedtschenkoi TaxID=63787 RepID=A0A7N0ZWU6_KALFE